MQLRVWHGPRMKEEEAQRVAALLERLAAKMREDGGAILDEIAWMKGRVDDNWHLSPSATGRDALRTAAARLAMSEDDLSLLVGVIGHAGR